MLKETQSRRIHVLQQHLVSNTSKAIESKDFLEYNLTAASSNLQVPILQSGEILTEINEQNGCLRITLNRPKALNSLSFNMLLDLYNIFRAVYVDSRVQYVIITAAKSCKAFCAGGDIKQLFSNSPKDAAKFFEIEFNVNRLIARCNKPVIAMLKGITMGGGCGLSMFASFRVANASGFQFAMPETGIGLYTDIGAGWFLSRYPSDWRLGLYLGLTGEKIRAFDALYCGFVTHVIPDSAFEQAEEALFNLNVPQGTISAQTFSQLDEWLSQYNISYEKMCDYSILDKQRQDIENLFDVRDFSQLVSHMTSLVKQGNEFAIKISSLLKSKCPMSMMITFEVLKRGLAAPTIEAVLRTDFRVATRMVQRSDFKEGVRALLIDKDMKPKWAAATQTEAIKLIEEPLSQEIRFSVTLLE